MKKLFLVLALFLMVGCLFAGPSFGYNVAPVGESFGGDSFAALEGTAVLSFTGDNHIGDVSVDCLVGLGSPAFKGVNVTLSTPLAITTKHPFNACFANVVLWEPKLSLGYQYRTEGGHRLMAGLSPFHFAERGFTIEFLSPYMMLDTDMNLGWGFKVMKFTAYIGG